MPSRDKQRYRTTYSYYRVQPRMEIQYIVDEALDWKNSVRAVSTSDVSLAGITPLVVDDVTLVNGNRVLLKDQSSSDQNGIYICNTDQTGTSYTLSRSSDANSGTLSCGATTYAEEGSSNAGKIYILSTNDPINVGSTSLTWTLFAGGGGGAPGGSNTHVQFNDGGSFGGSPSLKFNKTTGALTGTYVLASTGFSGSLTRLTDGTAYLIAGNNVTLATGSNGAVTISSAGGNDYWVSTTAGSIYSTGSVAIRGGLLSIDSAADIGSDVFFFVSGSIAGLNADDKKSLFGGDVVMSGSLDVFGDLVEISGSLKVTNGISGSLTRLTDGTPYLIAGTNVVLSTGSNGSITIAAAGGGGGGSTLPGGSVKDVQFNKDGVSFGGNTSFTFDESTSTMTVTNMSGSLTRLANGTSYLIAGNNVTITSASSGAVTIAAATGIGGSGTVNYVPKFATSTTLNNSILSQPYNNTMEIAPGGSPFSTELSLKNAVDPGKDGVLGLASSSSNSSGLSANAISGDVVLKAKSYTNSVILAIGTSEALRASYNSYTRVGIGTSSPDTTKFHVYSDVADVGFFDGTLGTGGTLSFRNRSGGNTTTLKLGYGTNTSAAASGNNAAIDYNASQNLIISRGGTEVARFDSSSQVGIGTTSTGAKLHVSSANDEVVRVQGTSGANPQVTLYRGSTLNGYLNAYNSGGDNYVSLFANSSNYLKLYSYSERIEMWPAGNLALTVETNGNVTLEKSSAVVDATTYPNQGIKLNAVPGNAGAQVLDAYYETEYTVTLESTVATGLFTLYSSPFNILKFTRVGRMMTLCGTLWVSNVQTTAYGKQRLYIDVPLPNAAYYPSVASAASVWVDDFSTGAFSPQGFIYTTGSSTRIYIDGVANLNQVDIADYVAVGSIITVSVTYVGASS